jgi:hypothetical protein
VSLTKETSLYFFSTNSKINPMLCVVSNNDPQCLGKLHTYFKVTESYICNHLLRKKTPISKMKEKDNKVRLCI